MHVNDHQTPNLLVVDPIADEGVWAIINKGVTVVVMVKSGRQNAEAKMKGLGLHRIWLHRKATTLSCVGTSTTSGKLNMPMAIRLQESTW